MSPRRKLALFRLTQASFRQRLLAILALALLARLSVLVITGPILVRDSPAYLAVGENLVRHGALLEVDSVTGELRPHTFRTPGFPVFAALFYALFGPGTVAHWALCSGQVLLATAIAAVVILLGRYAFSEQIGLAAGLLSALDPWLTYASVTVLSDALFCFVFMLTFFIGAVALRSGGMQASLFWGASLGVSTLVRPIAQHHFLLPIALFPLTAHSRRRKLALVGLALAGFIALVGGWRLRNRLTAGYWDLATHRGVSLLWTSAHLTRQSSTEDYRIDPKLAAARDLIAETAMALEDSLWEGRPGDRPHAAAVAFTALREQMGLSEREANRVMTLIALENLRHRPLYVVGNAASNALTFFTDVSMPVELAWALGLAEQGVVESLSEGRYAYPLLNASLRLGTILCFGPLLAIGMVSAWRRFPGSRQLLLCLAGALALHLVTVGLVQGEDRYRLPLHGAMWPFVVCGASASWRSFRPRLRHRGGRPSS